MFGLDIDDSHQLEAFADAMMHVLPDASAYDEASSKALDAVEEQFGGASVRERIGQRPKRTQLREFAWTHDAFVNTIAGVLGGKVAAEKWMGVAVKELGDRTPEEALRLGMGREVIEYLMRSGVPLA